VPFFCPVPAPACSGVPEVLLFAVARRSGAGPAVCGGIGLYGRPFGCAAQVGAGFWDGPFAGCVGFRGRTDSSALDLDVREGCWELSLPRPRYSH